MKKYGSVLFDLDGTLVDSEPGIHESILYATRKLGLPDPDSATLHAFFGPPLLYSFETILGLPLEAAEEGVRLYRQDYAARGVYISHVFPGIPEMLRALHAAGISRRVATSKPERFARLFLERYNLAPWVDSLSTQGKDTRKAGKDAIVGEALALCRGYVPALMVGDTQHDILGGAANALDAAGVTWGGNPREAFSGDNLVFVADNAQELTAFILGEK